MEIRKIIRTYSVDKSCDQCKSGFMRPTVMKVRDDITKETIAYYHSCNECGYLATYSKQYPCIEYGE
nr:MAG TPA: HTH-type transcriptional regulator [Caudoviricetes sp.]